MNSGIAMRIGISASPKNSIATMDKSISARANPSMALAAMTANSGAPSSATRINNNDVSSISFPSHEHASRAYGIAISHHGKPDRKNQLQNPGRPAVEQLVAECT